MRLQVMKSCRNGVLICARRPRLHCKKSRDGKVGQNFGPMTACGDRIRQRLSIKYL
ncbi:predicted protein [Plenodomus lingam JN3]|uniref:Predicted protein n=1 Tax=Leptosphaeria maculans (strain JN3 / isolate v23.1.3 / race Av1-4-5-6-7-8) TaxID=985895 RepID=E4ZUS3_LEPMJ|nr:predicted protein [Plenodomus lingam JN3]CBX95152.1 predicted protein [Plenodomus lingam JN3]